MKKNKLKKLIDEGKSIRAISTELLVSYTTVRYWMKKHNLKSHHKPWSKIEKTGDKINNCKICNKDFSTSKNRYRCGACNTKIRRYRTKVAGVNLLGGKCTKCGWTGNYGAFEFHHGSDNKEFNISTYSNKSWKVLKPEIEKCELLCSNCHRIEHSDYDDKELMKEVFDYSGILKLK